MRLHFSIRDLLWLTALAAVLVAWWLDHRRLTPHTLESFDTNLNLVIGGGIEVHEKIEDLSPEERQKLLDEQSTEEKTVTPSVQSKSEGGFGGNGGFGGGGF